MPVESTGLSRVKEALETVDWTLDEPLSSPSNLSELHDLLLLSEEEKEEKKDDKFAGNGQMKAEVNQLERDFFELKQAILQDDDDDDDDGHHHDCNEARSDKDDADQDLQIQKLELLMAKMQAYRHRHRHRHLDDHPTFSGNSLVRNVPDDGIEGNDSKENAGYDDTRVNT